MSRARINGAELFYDERGSGEPLLFHHGYTGSHDGWAGVVERLQDRYRCIVMDCRGAGDSEHTAGGYTIAQYADDVIGMADHLGLGRFTYIGHSMGGIIGMELGLRYAERLERLVLVAPAPADGVDVPPEMRERARRIWRERERETMIAERIALNPRPVPRELIARNVERALSVSEGHYEGSWEGLVNFRPGDAISAITTPTLVVAGAADSLLQANLKDFQRLPNATLHVFSRVGHGIPYDIPEEFTAVLADFLEHGPVTAAVLMERMQAAAGSR